jgi:rubrerythrin
MKHLLLASAFLFFTVTQGFAQQAVKQVPAKPNVASAKETVKVAFNKKLTELKDLLNKGDKEAATKSYMDMFELMHKAMGNYNEKLSKTTDETDRAAIQKTIVEEQTLYGEIKAQLIDIIGNKETLISKLEAYGKTIQ